MTPRLQRAACVLFLLVSGCGSEIAPSLDAGSDAGSPPRDAGDPVLDASERADGGDAFDAAVDAGAPSTDAATAGDAAEPDVDAWVAPPETHLAELVDPFIGTSSNRNINCFPGAIVPWGMVSASPDTTASHGNVPTQNHAAGYLSEDDLIQGFSHTRLQGTSTPDLGSVMLMPVVGSPSGVIREVDYRSPYERTTETAAPGYYAVTLTRPNVRAELTVTARAALHRYTFQSAPADGEGRVVVDLGHALVGVNVANAEVRQESGVLEGFTQPNGRFSGPSRGGLKVYYSIAFDPAPSAIVLFRDGALADGSQQTGPKVGAVASFPVQANGVVHARVGISYVDVAGARKNREQELTRDFEATREAAHDAWERELSSVSFEGGTDAQRTIMATALYHSFVVPTLVTDVDGRYRGYDDAIHTADFAYHANFSMWDTYRTVHPLLSLVQRSRQRDLTRSLIQMAREGGYYPRWAMGHGYPNITAGSPGAIVVAESFLRGVDGFDANEALDLAFKEVDQPPPAGHPHSGREGLAHYLAHGYVPLGTPTPGVGPRVVVRTLEYNIADGAMANMAHVLGRSADEARARAWSKSYTTLWDGANALFNARHADGRWWTPVDPFSNHGDLYYGANALQYSWLVPHDVFGLIALHGSSDAFVGRLRTFFEEAEAQIAAGQSSRYYTHVDEPDVHAMYLFDAAGRPDLTQKWVDWASRRFYGTGRDGIYGNEDAGTLSAWYVLSAMGLYPVTSTDVWFIGRPAFPRMTFRVAGGALVVEAPGAGPDAPYVQSVTLNGQAVPHPWLHHEQLAQGGVLHFEMGSTPGTWGTEPGSF